jgi:hypothetical protein
LSISPTQALRTFVQQRLTSIDQIDIVLLLMRDPDKSWTAPEVAAALNSPPEPAAMRLFLLASNGIITFEPSGIPRYRYTSADPQTHTLLTELAALNESDRAAVAALAGAPADPVRTFADAFKLKS